MAGTDFNPYHKWLGIPLREQPPNHYRLLGIALFEDDADVIDAAADRQMSYVRSCASGPHVQASQELLNELSAARLCLLTPGKRATYDAQLKVRLASPQEPSRSVPEKPRPIDDGPQAGLFDFSVEQPLPEPIQKEPQSRTPIPSGVQRLRQLSANQVVQRLWSTKQSRAMTVSAAAVLLLLGTWLVGGFGGPEPSPRKKPQIAKTQSKKTPPHPKKAVRESQTPASVAASKIPPREPEPATTSAIAQVTRPAGTAPIATPANAPANAPAPPPTPSPQPTTPVTPPAATVATPPAPAPDFAVERTVAELICGESKGRITVMSLDGNHSHSGAAKHPGGDMLVSQVRFSNRQDLSDKDLSPLRKLYRLQALEFHNISFAGDALQILQGVSTIDGVTFRGGTLPESAFRVLASFPNLKFLTIHRTRLSDPGCKGLAELRGLQTLVLSNVSINDEALWGAASLPGLSNLAVAGDGEPRSVNITDSGVSRLAGRSLRSLDLGNTRLTDAGLSAIASIKGLNSLLIDGTAVSDAGLDTLREASSLNILVLSRSRVTAAGMAKLQSVLPACRMAGPSKTDTIIAADLQDDPAPAKPLSDTDEWPAPKLVVRSASFMQRGVQYEFALANWRSFPESAFRDPGVEWLLRTVEGNGWGTGSRAREPIRKISFAPPMDYVGQHVILTMKNPRTQKVHTSNSLVMICPRTPETIEFAKRPKDSPKKAELTCPDVEIVDGWRLNNGRIQIELKVTNWAQFPGDLFRNTPGVQCIWERGDGNHANDRLKSNAELQTIIFPVDDEAEFGGPTHLLLRDNRTQRQYKSNPILMEHPWRHLAQRAAADRAVAERIAALSLCAAEIHFPDLYKGGKIEPGKPVPDGNFLIRSIGWSNQKQVKDDDLQVLKGATALWALNLSQTQVTGEGLSAIRGLKSLRELAIANAPVTDAGLAEIASFPNLKKLTLGASQITDAGLQALTGLTCLNRLELGGMQLTDQSLSTLTRLSGLRELFLGNRYGSDQETIRISDAGGAKLAALTNLVELDLGNTGVSDATLAALARIPTLEKLTLRGTKVTDRGIDELLKLEALTSLNVVQTAVTSIGTGKLRSKFPKCQVWGPTADDRLAQIPTDDAASANPPAAADQWPIPEVLLTVAEFRNGRVGYTMYIKNWRSYPAAQFADQGVWGGIYRVSGGGGAGLVHSPEGLKNFIHNASDDQVGAEVYLQLHDAKRNRIAKSAPFILKCPPQGPAKTP